MFHRPRLAGDRRAGLAQRFAGAVNIGHAERDMAVSVAQVVRRVLVPIMGQFDHRLLLFRTISDEGQGELAIGKIRLAQQFHAEQPGVEIERLVQVLDPDHGVEHAETAWLSHVFVLL